MTERNGPPFEFEGAEFIEVRTEKISIICPRKDTKEVMEKLYHEGWWTLRSGPMAEDFPIMSGTLSHIVAERIGPVLSKRFVKGSKVAHKSRRAVGL